MERRQAAAASFLSCDISCTASDRSQSLRLHSSSKSPRQEGSSATRTASSLPPIGADARASLSPAAWPSAPEKRPRSRREAELPEVSPSWAFPEDFTEYGLLDAYAENKLSRDVARALALEVSEEYLRERLLCTPELELEEPAGAHGDMSIDELLGCVQRGRVARDLLVNSNLRLVVCLAKCYLDRGVSLPDLIQEGALGLMRAAEKFNPEKGVRFANYAALWIRQSLRKAIDDDSRCIRLPRSFRGKLLAIKRAYKSIFDQYGRLPHLTELCAETGFSSDGIEFIIANSRSVHSLDAILSPEDGGAGLSVAGSMAWNGEGPEQRASSAMLQECLESVLGSALSEREQAVIRLRYGLCVEGEARLVDIARRYEVTSAYVRKIELRALEKLRVYKNDLEVYRGDAL